MKETTQLQDEIITKAVITYIDSEELLKRSTEQNDGKATDYLQTKMSSIVERLQKHFNFTRSEVHELITNTKNNNGKN